MSEQRNEQRDRMRVSYKVAGRESTSEEEEEILSPCQI